MDSFQPKMRYVWAQLFGCALAVAFVVGALTLYHRSEQRECSFGPLPAHPAQLSRAEVEMALRGDLKMVYRVEDVPESVRADFRTLTGVPFAMVDPGRPYSSDLVQAGLPNKRLVFLAIDCERAVLVYEQGGYKGSLEAMVVAHGEQAGGWGAELTGDQLTGPEDLARIVAAGRFKAWKMA